MESLTVAAQDAGLRELIPVVTGAEDCLAGHSFGPAVREHVLIHCVHSGEGRLESPEGTWRLQAGECFVIFPGQVTRYAASAEHPWHYTWLAFSGSRAEDLLRARGVTAKTPVIRRPEVSSVFEGLRSELQTEPDALRSGVRVLAAVLQLADALGQPCEKQEDRPDAYVRHAREIIDRLYADRLTVAGVARSVGLDRRYLCRIFKARTGLTLQAYLLRTRMENAQRLLVGTDLTVREVAYSVGYPDVCNFSRMFRRMCGASPTQLRESGRPE